MTDTKQVLQVTVTAERMPEGNVAYGIEIESDPNMPAAWAAEFLHGVATSIETDGFDTPEDDHA